MPADTEGVTADPLLFCSAISPPAVCFDGLDGPSYNSASISPPAVCFDGLDGPSYNSASISPPAVCFDGLDGPSYDCFGFACLSYLELGYIGYKKIMSVFPSFGHPPF